jgi:ubiquinone/menaquinone biosynthesis C-methylase UbiE
MTTAGSRDWKDVDRSADPRAWATYLENVSLIDVFRAYKRRALAMLDPAPGRTYLEVGCGTGVDARALASMVVPGGRVIAVDFSETLLAQARSQSAGEPVDYLHGDAHQLRFEDGTFDGCRSDRVFQHLRDPVVALAEMIRVAKPGAPIVITEPDWETYTLDVPDRQLFRTLLAHHVDQAQQNGWIGRELPRLFCDAGLENVHVTPEPLYAANADYDLVAQGTGLETRATSAVQTGVISQADADRWLEALTTLRREGRFWISMLLFTVRGTKPA